MRKIVPIVVPLLLAFVCGSALVRADDEAKSESKEELKPIAPAEVKLDRPVDFERDVYPILEAHCIACHNLAIGESKLNVEDVESILKGGKRGPAVVPKEPDKSLLYTLAARGKGPAMPPLPNKVEAEALTPQELGILRQWILEGAGGTGGASGGAVQWQPIPSGLHAIYSVALSPWSRFAACGRANQITVYDVITGEQAAQLVDPNLSGITFEGKPMYPGGASHRDFVHSLAFHPDGTLLASGGFRVVKLWKRPENVQKLQAALPAAVTRIAVSPDRMTAAVSVADHSVQLVNLADGKVARALAGHAGPVTGLAFTPDGAKLVTGSHDQSIRVWNLADGAAVGKINVPAPVNDLTLTKDGTQVISADGDNKVRVWTTPDAVAADAAVAAPVRELSGHEKPATSVALVLPEGALCATGGEDGTLRIWQIADGKQTQSLQHGAPVTAVAARPDGQIVASAGANGAIRLWQASDGKQVAEFKGDQRAQRAVVLQTEAQAVARQKFTAADNSFKAGEKDLKEREEGVQKAGEAKAAADKALEEAKTKEKAALDAQAAAKEALDKKPDDAELKKKLDEAAKGAAAQTEAVKKAVEAQASAERGLQAANQALKAATEKLAQLKTERDGAEAAQKQSDVDLAQAQQAATAAEKPVRALAFSPDHRKLLSAGDDHLVQLWDASRGVPLETFAGHAAPVASVAFAGPATLISGSADQKLVAWDANPAWSLAGQLGVKPDAPLELSESPFAGRVLALDFSDDGKLLATGGGDPSRSGELMVWDVAGLSLVKEFKDAHSDTVLGVEFSRDGKLLLSGGADKFVKIFDVASGTHVRSFEGHTHHVLDVSWKADGTAIASAGADHQIKVWNVESGEQARTISGYGKQVTAIQYMGVGENTLSCGGDATVRLHKTSDGANYRNFTGPSDFMYAAAAARDESLVVAGGEDGVLRAWNGASGESLFTFAPPPPAEQPGPQASAAPAAAK